MAVQISQDQREQNKKTIKEHGYYWQRKPDSSPRGFALVLFDPTGKQCTPEQALADIRNGTVPVYIPVYSHMDRPAAVRWAQAIVNRPQTARPVLILDTETSGLGVDDVVLEVSIVDLGGHVVFDSLFDPGDVEINPEAARTHGITNEMLREAAPVPALWDSLCSILQRAEIIIYNAQFDTRLLKQTAERHGLEMPPLITHCLMKQYAQYHGELKPGMQDVYLNKKLDLSCEVFGIVPGGHRALADAEASRQVLLAMADVVI